MKVPDHIALAPHILKRFLFYQRSQHWNKQQVLDYQNEKLREIVAYAGKYVPYYRELFKEIGVDPSIFRGIEDLRLIPYLDKDTLRTRTDEFVADTAGILGTHIEKTSGSTGTPLALRIDKISRVNKFAAYARAFVWAGYRPGALRFVLKGFSESKNKSYGYDPLRNMIYLNSSRMDKDTCLRAANLVAKYKPSVYEGYARSFIDFYNNTCHDYAFAAPKGIFVYGETITPQIREFVERAFKTHLYDFYSHAENAVMICENPDHSRYFMEDYFFPEILVENDSGDRNYGELVGTSFYNYSMPLIRYKTRDYVFMAESTDSAFRKVSLIEGRMDDFLILPDGRKIYFAEGALTYAKGVVAAQYIQDSVDHITVNMVVDNGFSSEYYPEIEKGLIKRIGKGIGFSFNIVPELQKKDSGKTPFIINRMNK